jgi:hypothetical protein
VLLSTRPQVRMALAEGAANRSAPKPPKPAKPKRGTKAPAAVARPKGFRSDEVCRGPEKRPMSRVQGHESSDGRWTRDPGLLTRTRVSYASLVRV